jgi:hypothetical protein
MRISDSTAQISVLWHRRDGGRSGAAQKSLLHATILQRPDCELVIDLGSGNNRLDDDIITLDAVDYSAVDIVADLARLPFKSDSIDAFASRSVLEHCPTSILQREMRGIRSGDKHRLDLPVGDERLGRFDHPSAIKD